ncbi:class E sortase [Aeromicrobium sp. A1-2]|uniref:sortase n=1 Tax=Aeromicrobium sp. A1-2 TaxID=2107713 RepID=UPI000E540F35|nr:sortase [Aeromicrobium sp. A1-2]AXT86176.1 class E sortase [Aeromicrobium sp. A1-2]
MTTTLAPGRPPKSAGRRVTTGVGVTLILAGLGLLVYFGWQYYGTNVVSKHKQSEIKQSLAVDWGKGIDSDAIGLLRVKRFGDKFEVPIVKGFDDEALARGVGWDTKSAKPGEIGNFAIAGHRVTHGEPFSKFPKLKRGDKVEVETRTHIYTYQLRNSGTSIKVDFSVSWPLWRVPDPDARNKKPDRAVITMLTCSELFHTNNRNIVIGDLVETIDKSKPRPVETD